MTYDDRRTSFLCFRFDDCLTDRIGIIARNLLNIPSPRLVFGSHIFGGHFAATCGELDGIRVIEHNEVIESEVSGQTACALRDLFLNATIGDKGIDGRVMNLTVAGVEPFGSDRSSYSERVSLSKRTGGILNHSLDLTLRVSGRN